MYHIILSCDMLWYHTILRTLCHITFTATHIHIALMSSLYSQQSTPQQKARKKSQAAANVTAGNLFHRMFGAGRQHPSSSSSSQRKGEIGTLVKQRKAPIKIEPKVFFANERTFLAWMHLSVMLAGASIAILAFAEDTDNPLSQLYGVILLPVAIAFIVYSMYQYARRAAMIRTRHPGPYEDTVGPAVLVRCDDDQNDKTRTCPCTIPYHTHCYSLFLILFPRYRASCSW